MGRKKTLTEQIFAETTAATKTLLDSIPESSEEVMVTAEDIASLSGTEIFAPSTPPKQDFPNSFRRNSHGLLTHLTYHFRPDGTVDWRKMAPADSIYAREGAPAVPIAELPDKDVIISIQGLRALAQIRGFNHINYSVHVASEMYFATTCSVSWIGNYETDGKTILTQAHAATSTNNTDGFAQAYLAEIAENRALSRCIRGFLRISAVAKEEFSNSKPFEAEVPSTAMSTVGILEELMQQKSVDWDFLKKKLITEKFAGAENLESVSQIPPHKVLDLIERFKKLN